MKARLFLWNIDTLIEATGRLGARRLASSGLMVAVASIKLATIRPPLGSLFICPNKEVQVQHRV